MKICKCLHIRPSDSGLGIRSLEAYRLDVYYPETMYNTSCDDEFLEQFACKDVVLYDEHHGTTTTIRKATVESIRHYLDEYTTIIVL